MLSDVLMTILSFFLVTMFAFGGVMCEGMVVAWGSVQNEAQSVAMIMSQQGGFTLTAENAIDQYLQSAGYSQTDTTITVTDPGGAIPFGTPVSVSITVPFQFQVGSFFSFPAPLTGTGRAASSYISAGGSEEYISP